MIIFSADSAWDKGSRPLLCVLDYDAFNQAFPSSEFFRKLISKVSVAYLRQNLARYKITTISVPNKYPPGLRPCYCCCEHDHWLSIGVSKPKNDAALLHCNPTGQQVPKQVQLFINQSFICPFFLEIRGNFNFP